MSLAPDPDLARSSGLAAALAGRLAAAIRAGDFTPGGRLPTEKQLVEQYTVSRAVVREAIARLKTDGYVETRQGAGAFVTARPGASNFRILASDDDAATDLGHVFELRGLIEAGMAELAAARRSAADLAAIEAAFAGMDAALASGEDGTAADDDFHAAIARAAGNPYLARFAAFLAQHFSATRAVTWSPDAIAAGNARASQEEHRQLLAAIAAGDSTAAAQAARSHIACAAARYQTAMQQKG